MYSREHAYAGASRMQLVAEHLQDNGSNDNQHACG